MSETLKAQERKEFKHSNVVSIRKKGSIPAVVYGANMESTPVEVDATELSKTLKAVGRNGVIELAVGNQKKNVMLTDYQYDYLDNKFIHADFLAVNLNKKLEADVTLVLEGTASGVKDEGGILQQTLYEVSVTARPTDLPENITVDISSLSIGDTVTVGDIRKNVSVEINNDDEEVIATVLAPRLAEDTEEDEAAAAVEPTEEVNS
ncbi:50S ribosomal protein L25/general stress protein Ctc [Bacillus testis]|uniref:50S ribosomal protein L25/general stress protein Ctc n=1 Tax=Bacillus testis TaxID=1622072 RepID=UPI00067F5774|nr:50S ribosomal protein L25/general stress protein Ctc [Bacillus testis]